VIEVGGSQLFVEPGKWYTVNRLKADVGSKIKFGRVLLHKNQDKVAVGQPYLEQVNVSSENLSMRATSEHVQFQSE
jgi:large subunit ribosomal protein L21